MFSRKSGRTGHRGSRSPFWAEGVGITLVIALLLVVLIPVLAAPVVAQDEGDGQQEDQPSEMMPQEDQAPEETPTIAAEEPPPTATIAPTATSLPPTPLPTATVMPTTAPETQVEQQVVVEPTVTPTVTAALTGEIEEAAIGVNWYLCPDDASVPTTVDEALAYPCGEWGDGTLATFTLYNGPSFIGAIELSPMTGAGFNNLLPDNFTLNQDSPYYSAASVFCESFGVRPYEQVPIGGGGAFLQLSPGEVLQCNWFSSTGVPPTPVVYGSSVIVRVWGCPPDIIGDLAAATTVTEVGQLKGQCDPHHDGGLAFSLQADGSSDVIAPVDNGLNYLFRNAPLGDFELTAATPFDDAATYCYSVPHDGSGVGSPALAGTGQTARFTIGEDEDVNCDVLAMFADDIGGDQPTATVEATPESTPTTETGGVGTVTIIPRNCPASYSGFVLLVDDPNVLWDNCNDPVGIVSYTVTSGAYNETRAVDPSIGQADFADVPSGYLELLEHPETGYRTLWVGCFFSDNVVTPEPEEITPEMIEEMKDLLAQDRVAFPFPLPAQFEMECFWFNVPDEALPEETPTSTVEVTPESDATSTPDATSEPTEEGTPETDAPQGTPDDTGETTPVAGTPEASPETGGTGALTNRVWTCPQGYVLHAADANPLADCSAAADGVAFVLDGPEMRSEATTAGAVTFGGLAPGTYTVTEMAPASTAEVFVLDCTGMSTSSVHPVPLATGATLQLVIASGDDIRCDWFNVQEPDPGLGWMAVTMFSCSTPAYVSDVDCLVYAGGQQLELRRFNGQAWVTVQTGTTDVSGRVVFTDLEPGTYHLYDPGPVACLVKSDIISDAPAGHLGVTADAQTTVEIYICGQPMGKPETPTTYPNTGVMPVR